MDVFNKLKSTVTSTVNQISSVLPGNPVTREYDITAHIGSAGQGLFWKVYSGTKKSTGHTASIFVLEKRQLDKLDMKLREEYLTFVKRGVSQLTRLRHPQVLIVQHPLEESRESLAFATESVLGSLANVLGQTENLPTPLPSHLRNYKLFDIEIKYGLMQIGEGLNFLHNDAKKLHHNICPQNIVINQQGAWKIFGFDFSIDLTGSFDVLVEIGSIDASLYNTPNYDYLAPECMDPTCQLTPASDMFSLGATICAVYNKGKSIIISDQNITSYKKNIQDLKSLNTTRLSELHEGLRDHVKMMLNISPQLRPDNHDFIKATFFDDVGVKTMNYLDSIFQWDNLEKSKFYKGLIQIMEKLPHRINMNRILPCLLKEFVNTSMVPFVLPNVLFIAENCTQQEYIDYVMPHLVSIMRLQEPIQVLLIFMQKMEVLLKLTPPDQVKSEVLPMLYRALESDSQQIQELCLTILPTFASLIEYPAMKNALLPRIKRLCISTSHVSVRVNCLVCLGKLIEYLDKWLVLDEILPFLPQIPSRNPAVLMGILGIYKLVLNHKKMSISKEFMATKILPFLMPLIIENSLSLNQFNSLVVVIKDMVNRVEAEHRTKLEQLNSISQEQRSLDLQMGTTDPNPPQFDLDDFFGATTSKQTLPSITSPNGVQSPLSFADKQRIINEKEAHIRLQNEPKLDMNSTNQIKDGKNINNSLENELMKMSLSAQSNKVHTSANFQSQQMLGMIPQQPSYNYTLPSMSTNQFTMQRTPMFPQQNTIPSLSNISQQNSMLNLSNHPKNASVQSQWNQQNTFSDLSILNKNKVPMNRMTSSSNNTSIDHAKSFNNNSSKAAVKPLSSSDINDLLN